VTPRTARVLVALALVLGARAEAQRQPGWEVRVADRVEVVPGTPGQVTIAIAVDRGLTVSRDADVIVDLTAPAAVAIRRRRLGRGDAVDPGADAPRFAVPVRAEQPGEHALTVRVRFWLCGGRTCRPIDVRRSALIAVTAPPAVDAGVAPADAIVDAPSDARSRRR
jgi:hypothetical protein